MAAVEDAIGGNFMETPGVVGKALKFDGFTTEIVRPAATQPVTLRLTPVPDSATGTP